jgi:hypothetical protein
MQMHFSTWQTTHFEQLERHQLIVERLNSGPFAYFKVSYTALAHGRVCRFETAIFI